jgi:nucleoside-diphosphate-sugar epimerase
MKIVVTGASGFLGSNLVNKLKEHGHDVLSILRTTPDPLKMIVTYEPDILVHCAWKGGNNYENINDISQISNVFDGVELLKVIASLPKKPKFIGFGSFAEYGDINNIATEDDFEKPINMYGLSKLTFKNYSESFCKMHDISWSWIRPCYVYGPGDVSTRLIPSVINKLLANKPVFLDSCNKIIDYIYIDDFINFTYNVIIGSSHGVYNICSGQQYKLRDVIQIIATLLNAEEYIHHNEDVSRDLTSTNICGSNLKVRQLSYFNKLTPLEEGLLKTIKYHEL